MKKIFLYILLPVIPTLLCFFSCLWLKILGVILLLLVQIINFINAEKRDKEIGKIKKYDDSFQTQYDDKGNIGNMTIDGGQF